MRAPSVIAVLLLPLCVVGAVAAPAPLPKPEQTAEAVFDAQTPERCRAVAAFIRSGHFAGALPSGPNNFWGQWRRGELETWLKANLTVKEEGTLIRVRMRGPVSALAPIADYLTGKDREDEDRRVREVRLVRWQIQLLLADRKGGQGDREDAEALRGWSEIEGKPLKGFTAPHALRRRR